MASTNSTSKLTWWLSLGVLVIAVIAAIWILMNPVRDDSKPAAPGAGEQSSAPAGGSTPDADGIGCEAPASDNRDVPEDLRWQASQGVTWPVSDTLGPTTTTDGFPSCFEHSPVGAALAAVTFLYSQIDHSPLEVGTFYVVDSPGKDAFLEGVDSDTASQLKSQLEGNGMSLVGFQIEEYDENRAGIRLVLRVPGSVTGFRGVPYPMQWVEGDWKLKPLDTGSTGQATDVRSDTFTYWTAAGNG